MKKIGAYFAIGLIIAFIGVWVSDVLADIFNGLPYGAGAVLGMCAYLCVVVITCTGIIVSKIEEKSESKEKEKE